MDDRASLQLAAFCTEATDSILQAEGMKTNSSGSDIEFGRATITGFHFLDGAANASLFRADGAIQNALYCLGS